ncbi:helix-turn-helix transcriptional regulator [Candidatus Zixiibacteriota bacterium]
MLTIQKRLVTIKELSEYIGYSPTTIRRFIAKRQIPFIYGPGGSYRFDVRRINRWIEEYSVKAEMDIE